MKKSEDDLIELYSDDNLFNLYLSKITDAYQNDKNKSYHIIKKYVDSLSFTPENNNTNKFSIKDNPKMIVFYVILICFAIVLLGLSNLENFPMYFFGSVFFFAGLLIGLFTPFFGLIFLFSHGLTGFCLMINALNENLASPIYSDASGYAYVILISLMVSFALLGFIFTIIHNIKINKDNKYRLLLPFIFFFISLFIGALFPELFKILNTVI